ncbi:hypothetical protein K8I61_02695 [bacterium]|nr:hypothetical protein [bacterium]
MTMGPARSVLGDAAVDALARAFEARLHETDALAPLADGYAVRVPVRAFGDTGVGTPLYLREFDFDAPRGDTLYEARIGDIWRPLAVRGGGVRLATDLARAADDLLDDDYARPARSVTTFLPFHYRRIPEQALVRAHRWLVGARRRLHPEVTAGVWPTWGALALLADIARACGAVVVNRARTNPCVVVFSHDIDGAEQLPFAEEIAAVEADACVSATFFAPAEMIRAHRPVFDRLAALGHEIGFHGIRHDNRHLSIAPTDYLFHLRGFAYDIERYNVRGFRSPSLLTSRALRRALGELFAYDSSIPDTDVYGEAGVHHGCGALAPFDATGIRELPITLPLDDRLFTLGERDPVATWTAKAERVFAAGGVAVLCTHACKAYYPFGFADVFERLWRGLSSEGAMASMTCAEAAANRRLKIAGG